MPIRVTVKKRFGITIDWFKVRRAKLLVIKKLHMRYVAEYKLLRSYATELVSTNPGQQPMLRSTGLKMMGASALATKFKSTQPINCKEARGKN
ncbi:hypothetical protein COLO4_19608 [Corchorus olitorius]|uniref:Uncharacterized protein n=1 Tax=Corchorus olitorius TaxID=93759 RepID=A0A1R3J4N7_9ROSI|nr:hypothetical protein COLO4_19608 [Corchorus olitorius]